MSVQCVSNECAMSVQRVCVQCVCNECLCNASTFALHSALHCTQFCTAPSFALHSALHCTQLCTALHFALQHSNAGFSLHPAVLWGGLQPPIPSHCSWGGKEEEPPPLGVRGAGMHWGLWGVLGRPPPLMLHLPPVSPPFVPPLPLSVSFCLSNPAALIGGGPSIWGIWGGGGSMWG